MVGKRKAYPSEFIDWLQRDKRDIGGLDHLGVQTVSIAIYDLLLPGITNLTDRARYFSYFPWVLHSFAQLPVRQRKEIGWPNWIRNHEFALVVASKAFEHQEDHPGLSTKSIIGANHAERVLKKAKPESVIDIAGGSRLDEKGKVPGKAYFKNMQGGYGQYYKGALTRLGLLLVDEENQCPDRLVTNYAGLPVAREVDRTKAFKRLTEIVMDGAVSVTDAAELGALVHPGLMDPEGAEAALLRDVLFGEGEELCAGQNPRDVELRRSSFGLILRYIADEKVTQAGFAWQFRWAAMTGMLRNGKRWRIPEPLTAIASAWAAYQRLELMNYALECLFWVAMYEVRESPATPNELVGRIMRMAIAPMAGDESSEPLPPLEGTVQHAVSACKAPKRSGKGFWGDDSTWQWNEALRASEENPEVCGWAARLLLRLVTDTGVFDSHPFETLPEAMEITGGHRISYKRWLDRVKARSAEDIEVFLADLVKEWVIFRHLRVATRKLANQSVSTFKLRPHEGVLIEATDEFPEPTYTNPRLSQAVQIMLDLHLVKTEEDSLVLTKTGKKYLGGVA